MSGDDIEVGCASPSNSVAECRSEYFSTRIEKMIQKSKEFTSYLEFQVEASRVHWTESTALNVEADGAGKTVETNMEVFQRLQKKYGRFFQLEPTLGICWNGKVAEGGQAEIFSVAWTDGRRDPTGVVLKVFKDASLLRDFEYFWGVLCDLYLYHTGSYLIERWEVCISDPAMLGRLARESSLISKCKRTTTMAHRSQVLEQDESWSRLLSECMDYTGMT